MARIILKNVHFVRRLRSENVCASDVIAVFVVVVVDGDNVKLCISKTLSATKFKSHLSQIINSIYRSSCP